MIYLRIVLIVFATAGASVAQTLAPSSILEDFDALHRAIEEAHGGLYRYSDKATIDKHFREQRAQLTGTIDKYGFISVIAKTLAGLHDGHMRLEYDERTNAEIAAAKMLPLRFAIEDSKLIVLFNDTKDNTTVTPGMEVISVNGIAGSDLIARILPHISGDGFIQTGKLYLIARNFPMYYWLFIERQAAFDIEVRDASGRIAKTKLEGVTNADRVANRNANQVNASALRYAPQNRSKNIMLQLHDGNDIASLSIRGFEGSDFMEELDTVFKKLHENKTKTVVLDLRGNGGGVDGYGAFLVSQFTDKPFRYFDRIHLRDIDPSFTTFTTETNSDLRSGTVVDPAGGFLVTPRLHPQIGVQQPGKFPFKGRLVVLTNGGTFSTAADVTATIQNMNRAFFVGEETGGAYEGNTSGLNARVVLPNSKLMVKVQMYDYWNAVAVRKKGRGTIPDYPVNNRVSDLVRGIDAQMAQAMKLARAPQ